MPQKTLSMQNEDINNRFTSSYESAQRDTMKSSWLGWFPGRAFGLELGNGFKGVVAKIPFDSWWHNSELHRLNCGHIYYLYI